MWSYGDATIACNVSTKAEFYKNGLRLYFWGVNGVFAEIVFTSAWSLIADGDVTLSGRSSAWSFVIYGLCLLLVGEPLNRWGRGHRVPLAVRVLTGVPVLYVCEFLCGALLKKFGAASWDYSDFAYNYCGVITLEYAPLWTLSLVMFEYMVSKLEGLEEVPQWKTSRLRTRN